MRAESFLQGRKPSKKEKVYLPGGGSPPGRAEFYELKKEGEDCWTYFPFFLKVLLALEMPLFLTEGP